MEVRISRWPGQTQLLIQSGKADGTKMVTLRIPRGKSTIFVEGTKEEWDAIGREITGMDWAWMTAFKGGE